VKVGLIIYGSLDTVSGGFLYDRMLVRALRRAGHSVAIFSLPWRSYPAHLADGLRLGWARRILDARLDLLLQDELNHPSLVLLNRLLIPNLGRPAVAIVHHLRSVEDHPPLLRRLYRSVERSYLAGVPAFLYNSATTAHTVRQLISQDRPGFVAVPAADHRDPPDPAAVMAALARRTRATRPLQVLFLGNVIPRKGLHTLLDALATLPRRAWRLQIVGSLQSDPAYVAALRARASRRHLDGNLTWTGTLDDAGVRRALETADLLAVPSYEGFGIAYLEAMAFGLPVIATTAGAAHEIVEHGRNGYLIARGDTAALAAHLDLLAANRVQLAALGYQARARYNCHPTWQQSMSAALLWLHELGLTTRTPS
jgi:glycosyltransferase involved in cell wall biosynthesis